MPDTILGRVAVVHKGAYNSGTSYAPLDEVSYNGSTYRCYVACTGVVPTTTSKWRLVSSKGSTGATGATGAKGDKGDKGDKGNTGATGPAGAAFSGTLSINASGELVLTT